MARALLSLEQKVLKDVKVLEMSMRQLKQSLDAHGGDFRPTLKVKAKGCRVKLILRCKRADLPTSWEMCLVMNNVPIDGIDWHRTEFVDHLDGVVRIGWHKHCWSAAKRHYKQRQQLKGFDPKTVEDFIRDGFKVLGIQLLEGDSDADRQMQIG